MPVKENNLMELRECLPGFKILLNMTVVTVIHCFFVFSMSRDVVQFSPLFWYSSPEVFLLYCD